MGNNKQNNKTQITKVQTWQGPLPPPEDLQKYNMVVPGAAERILTMAEEEMKHRHNRENMAIKYNNRLVSISTIFAFVCVVIFAGILCYAIYCHSDTAAIATAIGAIAAVVGLFTYGKSRQKK